MTRLLPLLLLLAGFGADHLHAQGSGARSGPERITEEEIRASAAHNLYEVIQTRRPNWLARRRPGSEAGPVILAFMDRARLGDVEVLRQFPAHNVQSIEYLSAGEVKHRFGEYAPNGGVLVTTLSVAEHDPAGAPAPGAPDGDDHLSLHLSAGWVWAGGSDWMAGSLGGGRSLAAALSVPIRPDAFLRLTYFQHGFTAGEPRTYVPAEPRSGTLRGGSLEWKGQMQGVERVVPYAVAGALFQHRLERSDQGSSTRAGIGYVVGLGVEARVAGPLRAFVEAAHTSATFEDDTDVPAQPIRAGLTLVIGGS